MKKIVVINGESFPFRVSMGALLRYKRLTGKEASSIRADDLEDLIIFLYCCVAAACSADGIKFDYSLERFEDSISPEDIEEMNKKLSDSSGDSKKK